MRHVRHYSLAGGKNLRLSQLQENTKCASGRGDRFICQRFFGRPAVALTGRKCCYVLHAEIRSKLASSIIETDCARNLRGLRVLSVSFLPDAPIARVTDFLQAGCSQFQQWKKKQKDF